MPACVFPRDHTFLASALSIGYYLLEIINCSVGWPPWRTRIQNSAKIYKLVAKAICSCTHMAGRSHKLTLFLNERKSNSYSVIQLLVLEAITKSNTFMLLSSVLRVIR